MDFYNVLYNYRTNKWEMKKNGKVIASFDTSIIPVTKTIKFTAPKDVIVNFNLHEVGNGETDISLDCGMV